MAELESKDLLPEFAKEAAVIEREEVDGLRDNAFADKRERKLPLHTKAASYLSALWYYGHSDPDPRLEDRILKSAEFFGISKEVSEIPKNLGYFDKKASEEDTSAGFALVVDRGADRGGVQRYYPMTDDYEVVKSAREADRAFFDGRLPPEYFRAASVELCKRAKALEIQEHELPRTVRENGQDRLPDFDRVKSAALLTRKQAGVDERGLEIYANIIEEFREDGDLEEAESNWNRMDQVCGVKYASGVPTLYELLYNGETMDRSDIEKYASENVVVGGVVIPGNVLGALPREKVAAYFGEDRIPVIEEILEASKTDCTDATVKAASLGDEDSRTLLEMAYKWAD